MPLPTPAQVPSLNEVEDPRNWKVQQPITRGQRKQLEKYEFSEDSPPSSQQIVQIARECKLRVSQVSLYFKNYLARKRRESAPLIMPTETLTPASKKRSRRAKFVEASNSLSLPASRRAEPNKKKLKKNENGESEAEEDVEEDEDIEKRGNEETQDITTMLPHRSTWSSVEDSKLMESFILLADEDDNSIEEMISNEATWTTISKKLGKPPAACWRRFQKLMKDGNCKTAVRVAIKEKQMKSSNEVEPIKLPENVASIHKKFAITELGEEKWGKLYPPLSNSVLADCIIVMLQIPEEDIQSSEEFSMSLITKYSEEDIRIAMKELKERGVIVKNKNSHSKRSYQLSSKFNRFITSQALPPTFFSDCRDAYTKYCGTEALEPGVCKFPELSNGGNVATTLALLQQGAVRLVLSHY